MSPKKIVKKPETMKVVRKQNGQISKKTHKVEMVTKEEFHQYKDKMLSLLELVSKQGELEVAMFDLARVSFRGSIKRLGIAVWSLLGFDVVMTIVFVKFSSDIIKYLGGL